MSLVKSFFSKHVFRFLKVSSLRLYIVPSKKWWIKVSFWAKSKMAAVFIGKTKNLYISQNILIFQVWLLYKYVFGVKESISVVIFQVLPNLREMGVKNTLFWGQNGQNWEYWLHGCIGKKQPFKSVFIKISYW